MTEMIIMRYRWCVERGEKVRTAESFARSDYREADKRQQEESGNCDGGSCQTTRIAGKLVAD